MGSYTTSQLVTPLTRLLLFGSATVGDKMIITLNGVDVTYTVQPGEDGYVSAAFATAMAAAINASTAIDPVSKVAINKAFCAEPAILRNPVTREESVCLISTQPGYDHAFAVSTRTVPVQASSFPPYTVTSGTSPNFYITVTDTIAAGSVLTTVVNLQSSPSQTITKMYTVVAGDTALSIAGHIATQLVAARPNQIKVAQNGSTLVIFNCEPAGTLTFTTTLTPPVVVEKPTLYMSGRFLHDRRGNQVVLRGVNLQLLDDWAFPGSDYLSEVAKTGANAIRIEWYQTYPNQPLPAPQRPEYKITDLGAFLDRCVAAKIVPIVSFFDVTDHADPTEINSVAVPWWTEADVKAVLQPRQAYLILNLANELGQVRWPGGDPTNATDPYTAAYRDAYKAAILSMRQAGYLCPLMIDAPDGGSTVDVFNSIGPDLVAADAAANLQVNGSKVANILLSVHAYWAAYHGTQPFATAVTNSLPMIVGEIANKQDDVDANGNALYCQYNLDAPNANSTGYTYQDFLGTLMTDQVGWLVWSWYPDSCNPRNMSSDGSFAALTPYGVDIVTNGTYGLSNKKVAAPITP